MGIRRINRLCKNVAVGMRLGKAWSVGEGGFLGSAPVARGGTTSCTQIRRDAQGPCSEGTTLAVMLSVAMLQFLIGLEQGSPYFHFTLGSTDGLYSWSRAAVTCCPDTPLRCAFSTLLWGLREDRASWAGPQESHRVHTGHCSWRKTVKGPVSLILR